MKTRWLRVTWWCNLHGIIDKTGLEFSIYSRSSHYANLSNPSERKSAHSIRSYKGTWHLTHLLTYFQYIYRLFDRKPYYTINFPHFRVNIVWHAPSKALNLWSRFTRKMVCSLSLFLFLSSLIEMHCTSVTIIIIMMIIFNCSD